VSLASEFLARQMHLPRAETHDVVHQRDLAVPMDDGAVLLADRWVARATQSRPQPTVLVRSPYGRTDVVGVLLGRLLAERGLQVVIQSVRGTFGSGGSFSPFDERADGLATLRWIRARPWHAERIGMIGPSYLGLVQWAVAPEGGEDLRALSIQVSASQFHGQAYAGGSMSLENSATWLALVAAQERRLAPLAVARAVRRLPALLTDTPLSQLDERATGGEVAWFREALASPGRADAYWVARDYAAGVSKVTVPVQLIGGWYDIFLPWMLEDFAALQSAGRETQLIIGPWTHAAPAGTAAGLRHGLAWLRAQLLDDDRLVRPEQVTVYVTGEREGGGWRALPSWPPPGAGETRLSLASNGQLTRGEVPAAGADRYRYDPADPTPSLGGPVLLAREPVRDNRPLEQRPDVLTYTTPLLDATLEAIGPVRVELWVRASNPHFDVFARVCDVDEAGASWNVCDALARVAPGQFDHNEDGTWRVSFALWPIAHRFAAGRRIRLQLSSGAHPRYARNPGSGADPATATTDLRATDVELVFGPDHPSALFVPTNP
jgi:putative CocE/NonD family hydrolase